MAIEREGRREKERKREWNPEGVIVEVDGERPDDLGLQKHLTFVVGIRIPGVGLLIYKKSPFRPFLRK